VAGLLSSYSTGIGGRREIALPDGSTAYLNTSSAISLAFDAGQRRLSLDAGEALFAVAADAARPFAVSAAAGVAVAHGTVFGMRRTGDEVGVFVAEGSVEVQLGGNPAAARLEPGQGLRYRHGRIVTPVTAVDIAAATAWQRGKLIFNRRPLAEVTRELERYRFGRIVIANAALRDMPVTGVFDLADTDAALDTIERTLPIKVSYLPLLTVLR
jgi:transmembrane sensor